MTAEPRPPLQGPGAVYVDPTARITSLEARNADLEARLGRLEARFYAAAEPEDFTLAEAARAINYSVPGFRKLLQRDEGLAACGYRAKGYACEWRFVRKRLEAWKRERT